MAITHTIRSRSVSASRTNYQDWRAGITTKWVGVNWSLTYVDTNLDDNRDCYGNKQLCEATAVFGISKSL